MDETSAPYSKVKIAWWPKKLASFVDGTITAPIYVRVKPLNRCNHKCFWCVYHEPELSAMHGDMRKTDMIPTGKLMEVLDDFVEIGVRAVTYSGGGEPLQHPDIASVLEATRERGIGLSVITNGAFLKGSVANALLDAAWVRVSIDYCTPEGFEQSRRIKPKGFKTVIDNIEAFAKSKNKACDLCVNFIITYENHRQIRQAAELLISLGVENIRFSPMWIHNFVEYHEGIKDWVIAELDSIIADLQTERFRVYSSYTRATFEGNPNRREYTKCYVMQTVPVIGADLNVYACHNQAYSSDSIICSIKDSRFRDAWFSEEAAAFHAGFNCQQVCQGQCSSDAKNLFIHELLNCRDDAFV